MISEKDVVEYTVAKQDLQITVERLIERAIDSFDISAFLANPRGYMKQILGIAALEALKAVAGQANQIGQQFAEKAAKE
jgi:hypothetical protein